MIRLMLNNYTPEQCHRLADLLHNTASDLCDKQGAKGKCNLCPVRRICSDLAKASEFAQTEGHVKYQMK